MQDYINYMQKVPAAAACGVPALTCGWEAHLGCGRI